MASRTESEIWSETLSGWPSETDSDVNRNSLFISGHPTVAQAPILAKTARLPLHLKLLLRPLARLPLAVNHATAAFLGRLVYALSPPSRRRAHGDEASAARRLQRRASGPGAGPGRGRMGRLLRAPRVHHDSGGTPPGGVRRGARVLLRRAPSRRPRIRAAH